MEHGDIKLRLITAIMGCELHARDGHHDAIRDTWGRDLPGWSDLRFFVGRGNQSLKEDEIRLDVPDEKNQLIFKVEGMLRWCCDQGYDAIFKINTNTYVNVNLVRKQKHERYDYAGAVVGKLGNIYGDIPNVYGFIQGSASWLSSKASRIVVESRVAEYAVKTSPTLLSHTDRISPYPHSEDLWIGQVLRPHLSELTTCVDQGYSNGPLTFWSQSNYIKLYKLSEWMHRMHEAKNDSEKMYQVNKEYPRGWQ